MAGGSWRRRGVVSAMVVALLLVVSSSFRVGQAAAPIPEIFDTEEANCYEQSQGNLKHKCYHMKMDRSTLVAECVGGLSFNQSASSPLMFDLSKHVYNNNGSLTVGTCVHTEKFLAIPLRQHVNCNFMHSCRNTSLDKETSTLLHAECDNGQGKFVNTKVELNDYIHVFRDAYNEEPYLKWNCASLKARINV